MKSLKNYINEAYAPSYEEYAVFTFSEDNDELLECETFTELFDIYNNDNNAMINYYPSLKDFEYDVNDNGFPAGVYIKIVPVR